jgi:predicted Zn-dependent protease
MAQDPGFPPARSALDFWYIIKGAAMTRIRKTLLSLAASTALLAAACATIDSTPEAPSISQGERTQAAQQHPQILAQFGGEVEGPTASYVDGIGERIATAAGVPGQCTFSVVNTEVPNAFAVPGCYIYITRGLLAIMNSEDELASVLGHEVGHVVADHSARRQNTAALGGLGAIVVGILTGSGDLAQVAAQAATLYTLNYSRDQEFEADDLGVRYLGSAGYNPYAAADMLNSLGLASALNARIAGRDAESAIPTWARTHPLSADRVTRANAQAQATGAVRGQPPEAVRPYLQAVNGLTYGDDPEQGFVIGRTFAHPVLRIAFDAPQGFTLTNTSTAVLIGGPNNLRGQFGGAALPAGGVEAHARAVMQQVLGQAPSQVGQVQRTTINGLEAAILPARAQTQSGQVVDVSVAAYRVGDRAYHFITVAPTGTGGPFGSMIQSMRTLTAQQAAALRERRLEVVTVRSGDTAQSLAQRMAFDDFKLDRFLAINGLDAGAQLRAGEQVKIVTFAG